MKDYTYQNTLISKKQLKDILSWSFTKYGSIQACFLADELKILGFKYATQAGISISIEDLRVPYIKNTILQNANQEILNTEKIYLKGKITILKVSAACCLSVGSPRVPTKPRDISCR